MLEPLGGMLLVKPEKVESKTASGLHLPDQAKDKPERGVIVAVGPKVEDDRLAEGRTVVYSRYGGTETTEGEDELMVLREADLIALVGESG